MENETRERSHIMELIAGAPWREAITYRDTWPHEYVVVNRDGQQELLAAFCERISRGEGVECRFFHQKRPYLFLGDTSTGSWWSAAPSTSRPKTRC